MQTLKAQLIQGLALQNELTARWHDEGSQIEVESDPQSLAACIAEQHACNFRLWHIEDTARRTDVSTDVIAQCKREIDAMNQRRNDGMERVDACLVRMMEPLLPVGAQARYNTESLGMAVDRMSILSLKIWHMDEQLRRTDVDAAHVRSCADKAAVLRTQRGDVERSIMELLDEFAAGTKSPRLYFQFKMYNDPSLNPELYGQTKAN